MGSYDAYYDDWRRDLQQQGLRYERFTNTEYVCDASDFERHLLWERWHAWLGVPWRQHNIGHHAKLTSAPISVTTWWAQLGADRMVAFISGTSAYVNHLMIEEWRDIAFPKHRTHCDAQNFHLIVNDISERDERAYVREHALDPGPWNTGTEALDLAREHVPFALETAFPQMTLQERFEYAERKMLSWGERARAYQQLLAKDRS